MKKVIAFLLISIFFISSCKKNKSATAASTTVASTAATTSTTNSGAGGNNGSGFRKLKKMIVEPPILWPIAHYSTWQLFYYLYGNSGELTTVIENDTIYSTSSSLSDGERYGQNALTYTPATKIAMVLQTLNRPGQPANSYFFYNAASQLTLSVGTHTLNDSTTYSYTGNMAKGISINAAGTTTYYYSTNLDSSVTIDQSNTVISKTLYTHSPTLNRANAYTNIYYYVIDHFNELTREVIYTVNNGVLSKYSSSTFAYTYDTQNYPTVAFRTDTNFVQSFTYGNPEVITIQYSYY